MQSFSVFKNKTVRINKTDVPQYWVIDISTVSSIPESLAIAFMIKQMVPRAGFEYGSDDGSINVIGGKNCLFKSFKSIEDFLWDDDNGKCLKDTTADLTLAEIAEAASTKILVDYFDNEYCSLSKEPYDEPIETLFDCYNTQIKIEQFNKWYKVLLKYVKL